MSQTPDLMILRAIDAVVESQNSETFSAKQVATELTILAGHPVTTTAVRKLLTALPEHEVIKLSASRFKRYPRQMRDAWAEADRLAKALGGEANHFTSVVLPANITISVERAREMLVRRTIDGDTGEVLVTFIRKD